MARKKYSAEFKSKVAIEAIKGEETTNQIAARFGVHPAQVRQWKRHVLENASAVFKQSKSKEREQKGLIEKLYRAEGEARGRKANNHLDRWLEHGALQGGKAG